MNTQEQRELIKSLYQDYKEGMITYEELKQELETLRDQGE